jgi:hypothetical protein
MGLTYYAIKGDAGYYHGYSQGGKHWRDYPKLWRRRGEAKQSLNALQVYHRLDRKTFQMVKETRNADAHIVVFDVSEVK